MKKTLFLVLGIMFVLTGCGKAKPVDVKDNNQDNINTQIEQPAVEEENVFKYDAGGKIIEFEDQKVHILTGDIIQIYDVSNDVLEKFYLGENVGLKKQDDDTYTMESVIVDNFDMQYNTMGNMIKEFTGNVFKVSDDEIVVGSKEETLTFKTYQGINVEKGADVTVEYTEIGEVMNLVRFYNESNVLELTVTKINRTSDGLMLLDMKDASGAEYKVPVEGRVMFNHSELKTDDTLRVYYDMIQESYPAQVSVKKLEIK